MKAVVLKSERNLEVLERPIPELENQGQVLIKTRVAGVCGSDQHIYHGKFSFVQYPRVIGHEVVGEVRAIGKEVQKLKIGDRVAVEPIRYCGQCYSCRINRPNVCENLQIFGVNLDGAFQEYFVAESDKCHRLPEQITWEEAALIEPFSIGAQVMFRADVGPLDTVLIYGSGTIGLSVMNNAHIQEAKTIVCDLRDDKLHWAQAMQADLTINSQRENVREKVLEFTDGKGPTIVVDAVGMPALLEQAIALVAPAGRVVSLGFNDEKAPINMLQLGKKELSLLGSRLQTHRFPKVLEYFKDAKVLTPMIVTHQMPFTDLEKAFHLMDSREELVGKILLSFDD